MVAPTLRRSRLSESVGLEAVLKTSRAPAEQGARRRRTAVYKGVHEDSEPSRNAAQASAVVFKDRFLAASVIAGAVGTYKVPSRFSQ